MIRIALISFLTNDLSIRLLSAYLKKNGFEVICLFCPTALNKINTESIISLLKSNNILLAGITLVTDDYDKAVVLTSAIKQCFAIPVIWGGAHPSIMPEECLRHADMVCIGEGEDALLELAQSLSCKSSPFLDIKNIYFKTNDGIVRNDLRNLEEDLDRYPFPDFKFNSQFLITEYGSEAMSENFLEGTYSLMTSRGCPYSCCYCYNSYRRKSYAGKGKYLRARSIWNVINELVEAKKNFKSLKKINFWDDSFVARDINDFILFKELYLKEINLPFYALVEPMAFNFEKVKILKESKLSELQIGIQSGSERTNRVDYNRLVSNIKILEIADFVHDLGVNIRYDVIFNNPYETKEDLKETISLFLKFPRPFFLQGFNIIFFPGTAITEKALRDGLISPNSDVDKFSKITDSSNSPIVSKGVSVESNRFYNINYNSTGKEYFYLVFSLLGFNHIPKQVIKYFMRSESKFKLVFLKILIEAYVALMNWKKLSTRM